MRATVTHKPIQEVLAAIQTLDLESVKFRLMDSEVGKGWTQEYVDRIEAAYKKYLTMLVKYQEHAEDILISKDVDEFWHTHILQTLKYADDCQRVFGTFIHHTPHVGSRETSLLKTREVLAAKTRTLYEEEFGSAQEAALAWFGVVGDAANETAINEQAALSSFESKTPGAAPSVAGIRADGAALSSYQIQAGRVALSSYEISTRDAALSSYAIGAEHAALSSYQIRAERAGLSSYAIDEQRAALSSYSGAHRAGIVGVASSAGKEFLEIGR